LVRADSADWSGLGKEGDAWKDLAVSLLDEGTYANFNAAAARQEWLDRFRPKKSKFISVPPPAHAPPAGPTVGGEATAKPASEVCAEIDAIIQSGKIVAALSAATKALVKQESPSPEILSRIDYCVAGISPDEIGRTDVLSLLEEAANLGSVPATSRLGLALVKIEPDEAYTWLEKAASHGDVEAIPHLARLYEDGTPQHPANPAKAVGIMNQWREIQPDVHTDYLYAAMILRGKIGVPGTEALTLLEGCHERGHYRSTDLLAQCHATGIASPIDEKRASNLFAEAWNRSKAANQEYHTASNNLGVCFATGFGVPKDMEKAKHYFRQGALAKHGPSEENLSRLTQAANARL
ncbi:MAG: sel1 repeat family protein, partial [Verrucomicrobiaceae bacterium]